MDADESTEVWVAEANADIRLQHEGIYEFNSVKYAVIGSILYGKAEWLEPNTNIVWLFEDGKLTKQYRAIINE